MHNSFIFMTVCCSENVLCDSAGRRQETSSLSAQTPSHSRRIYSSQLIMNWQGEFKLGRICTIVTVTLTNKKLKIEKFAQGGRANSPPIVSTSVLHPGPLKKV